MAERVVIIIIIIRGSFAWVEYHHQCNATTSASLSGGNAEFRLDLSRAAESDERLIIIAAPRPRPPPRGPGCGR